MFRNRYVRCFVASGVAGITAGKVIKLLDWAIPELTPADNILNTVEYGSIIAVIGGIGAVLLAAAFGVPEGTSQPAPAAAAGGAA